MSKFLRHFTFRYVLRVWTVAQIVWLTGSFNWLCWTHLESTWKNQPGIIKSTILPEFNGLHIFAIVFTKKQRLTECVNTFRVLHRMWQSVHTCQPSLSEASFLSPEERGTKGGPGESSVRRQHGCSRVACKVSDLNNTTTLFCVSWYHLMLTWYLTLGSVLEGTGKPVSSVPLRPPR